MAKLIVVSGMQFEAECAKHPNVINVLSGGSESVLSQRLSALDLSDVKAIISFGVAGALHPDLRAGEVALAGSVQTGLGSTYNVDTTLNSMLEAYLRGAGIDHAEGCYYSDSRPHYLASEKLSLFNSTKCLAVDMETAAASKFAHFENQPFLVMRAVSDPQNFDLPPLAYTAMNPDGTLNWKAIDSDVWADLQQVGALAKSAFFAGECIVNLKRMHGFFDLLLK